MKGQIGNNPNQNVVSFNNEANERTIKVLIADHFAITRSGLATLLSNQIDFEVVGEEEDSDSAIEAATNLVPDLVIINRNLPNQGYLRAVRRIRDILPTTKVVVVVDQHKDTELDMVFGMGGHGYLTSDITPNSLFQMFRGVICGEAAVSRHAMGKFLQKFSRPAMLTDEHPLVLLKRLHPREQEVLELLVKNGESNKRIALDLGIAENTVKNHFKSILEKLKVKNRVQAAIIGSQIGFS